MNCVVYKGSGKPGTYLFIRREGDFSQVPKSLQQLMGALQLVMSLELPTDTSLAEARIEEVLKQLDVQGFYLQLPSSDATL